MPIAHTEATRPPAAQYCGIGPCGGVATIWLAPYVTQYTVSDPDNMALRTHEVRAKAYKALIDPRAPVNGDHIEGCGIDPQLSYMFPLVHGIGAVYQTYWWDTEWGGDDRGAGNLSLYKKWFAVHTQQKLSRGEYRGDLYDLANDKPGTHAIAKGRDMFYLFAPKAERSFTGTVQLRGLEKDVSYEIIDYANDVSKGTFYGPTVELKVTISKNMPLVLAAMAGSSTATTIGRGSRPQDMWLTSWKHGGTSQSLTNSRHSGDSLRFLGPHGGAAVRTLDATDALSASIRLWWGLRGLSPGDYATLQVFDGTWQDVLRMDHENSAHASNFAYIDLSGYNLGAPVQIRINAHLRSETAVVDVEGLAVAPAM